MADDQEPQEPPQEPQDGPQESTEPQGEQTPDQDPDRGKAGREAARYRHQLRDVEGERDALMAKLAELEQAADQADQKREIEDLAHTHDLYPQSVEMLGRLPRELRAEVAAMLPRRPKPDPFQGRGGSDKERPGGHLFEDAFKPHQR